MQECKIAPFKSSLFMCQNGIAEKLRAPGAKSKVDPRSLAWLPARFRSSQEAQDEKRV
jgi:hypothetical protein